MGIGRLGSIGGPLLIGVLLAYQLSAASLFYGAAVPMLLARILVMLLSIKYKTPRASSCGRAVFSRGQR